MSEAKQVLRIKCGLCDGKGTRHEWHCRVFGVVAGGRDFRKCIRQAPRRRGDHSTESSDYDFGVRASVKT
jgi:hypothetical protein